MGLASALAAQEGGGGAAGAPPGAPPGAWPQQAAAAPPQAGGYPGGGAPPAAAGWMGQQPQQPPPQAGWMGQQPQQPPPQAGWMGHAPGPPQAPHPGAPPAAGWMGQAPPAQAPSLGGGGYGAPAAAPPPRQDMRSVVYSKLVSIATANQLQRFYSADALVALTDRICSTVDFAALAARWRMPSMELAVDLAALALYDVVIYGDDSGSMESGDGERIADLKLIVSKVAEAAVMFDDDGVEVRFINSNVQGNHIKNASDVDRLFANLEFRWDTKIGAQLQAKILEPLVYNRRLAKPLLIITITDGEPSDKPPDRIVSVITDCVSRVTRAGYGPHAVAFAFAQVGRDREAQEFLARLDRHPVVGSMIDCTSYFELEQEEYSRKGLQLSVSAWLCKLMVGAIDPSYDAEDEGGAPPPPQQQQPPQQQYPQPQYGGQPAGFAPPPGYPGAGQHHHAPPPKPKKGFFDKLFG